MFALVVALAATLILTPEAAAQKSYTVWSTVLLTRTGERTPTIIGNIPVELTSTGANQAYDAGAFFRSRYVTDRAEETGITYAPLVGLDGNYLQVLQTNIAGLDEQFIVASAQAFLQGFYPPRSNVTGGSVDQIDIVANGTIVDSPLNGYQYAQIHAFGGQDPSFTTLDGSALCPTWDMASATYANTAEFSNTTKLTEGIYAVMGSATLAGILDIDLWTYTNAYAIYDYLRYQYNHNATVKATLDNLHDTYSTVTYLDKLRWFADQQQYAVHGKLTTTDGIPNSGKLPGKTVGSISTIAGNTLAAQVLSNFQQAVLAGPAGAIYSPLNLYFADFQPFVSFFSLAQLPRLNSYFYGLPDFASTMVFELYSYSNTSEPKQFPSADNLYVRFSFRNGTTLDPTTSRGILTSHPLFGNDPDRTDLSWSEFQAGMASIALGETGDWCTACGASNIFCAAYNVSNADAAVQAQCALNSDFAHIGPVLAGIVGALIALVLIGLLLAAVMLFAGVRLQRAAPGILARRRSNGAAAGGFKGGQKMASDQDLTLPKGGAIVTKEEALPESPLEPVHGHERVGSWELKSQQQQQQQLPQGRVSHDYPHRDVSFDDERIDPFTDPVKPRESV